jgi:hypothetical protein
MCVFVVITRIKQDKISGELSASIFRAEEASVNTYQTKCCHIPEESNLKSHKTTFSVILNR